VPDISGEIRFVWVGRSPGAALGGRCPRLISSVIRLICREIEAQLIVSMLVLDTAADAIVRRAGNHQST
jgi:hypothetical protein